jgi:hypothetical protein
VDAPPLPPVADPPVADPPVADPPPVDAPPVAEPPVAAPAARPPVPAPTPPEPPLEPASGSSELSLVPTLLPGSFDEHPMLNPIAATKAEPRKLMTKPHSMVFSG